ncbi:MAG: hypothetical protein SNG69_08920 [Rikenellaceae bacterium]
MAEKIDIANELEQASTVDTETKLLAYFPNGGGHKYISILSVLNGSYACRRWDTTASSPIGEAYGNIDYLANLPSTLGLGCYLVDTNHGRRKLDATDHYKYADGSTAALDGSEGDYMWGWSAAWYYATWYEGDYLYEAIGLNPIPGKQNYFIPVASTSALGVAVMDRDTGQLVSVVNNDARYRGGDNDSTKDTAYNTLLGRAATKMTSEAFGTAARVKGTGWEGYWIGHSAAIGILFRIIFGTCHVQTDYNASKDSNGLYQGGLGSGVTGAGTWWTGSDGYNYYPFLPTSVGVELGDSCGVSSYAVPASDGSTAATVNVPVFFGLKNFYGYLNRWGRGELIYKNENGEAEHYVCPSLHQNYSMSSLDGLELANTAPANDPAGWLYITQLSMNKLVHSPTVATASSSTYYCDGYYNDNAVSAFRVPARGGAASSSGIAGLEYLSVSFGVTATDAYCGSPLCEAEIDWSLTATVVNA